MTPLRRLDHVAVAVRDTDEALRYFGDRLGLRVTRSEEIPSPHVRLTYLDAGNAYIQLVEPLDADGVLSRWLDENGEGRDRFLESPYGAGHTFRILGNVFPVATLEVTNE